MTVEIDECSLESVLRNNVWRDTWGGLMFDPDCEWTTDDLIELGVIINKILKERQDG